MAEGSGGNGNVLVVEDESSLNQLVGAYVELAGFDYRPALDGQSALQAATQSNRAQPLDFRAYSVSDGLAGAPVRLGHRGAVRRPVPACCCRREGPAG